MHITKEHIEEFLYQNLDTLDRLTRSISPICKSAVYYQNLLNAYDDYNVDSILADKRNKRLSLTRSIIYYYLRNNGATFEYIANVFGKNSRTIRDHYHNIHSDINFIFMSSQKRIISDLGIKFNQLCKTAN